MNELDVQRVLDVLNSPLLAADEYVAPYIVEKQKWLLTKGLQLCQDGGEWQIRDIAENPSDDNR